VREDETGGSAATTLSSALPIKDGNGRVQLNRVGPVPANGWSIDKKVPTHRIKHTEEIIRKCPQLYKIEIRSKNRADWKHLSAVAWPMRAKHKAGAIPLLAGLRAGSATRAA
jgi:hypothetical protein